MKKFLIALFFAPVLALAAGGNVHLDKWPGSVSDKAALQNGAKLFVNYCLNCHSASFIRYKTLVDIGLTEEQIKENLMFTGEKIGDLMQVAARHDEQKKWFGATPPDLTSVARARGEAGELQGTQVMDPATHKLSLAVPGKMSPAEYDKAVSDLVSFMVWMAEPQQEFRKTLGYIVLAFLALLFVVAYALKKEYWKDIH